MGRVDPKPLRSDTMDEEPHGMEIVSMEMEYLYRHAAAFARDDPEYFDFIRALTHRERSAATWRRRGDPGYFDFIRALTRAGSFKPIKTSRQILREREKPAAAGE